MQPKVETYFLPWVMWKKPINPDGVAQQWNSILLPVKLFNPDRVGFVLVCNPKVETVDFNLGLYCGIPLEFHSLSGLALGYRFAVYFGEFLIGLHQFLRNRAGFAVADDTLVDLHHRYDLRTGAGEETFVGVV